MPYLGNISANRFASTPATKRFSGNGSTTSFTLDTAASADQEILVSVDGVIQDSANYTVTGTTLDFGSGNAPSAGTNNIFVNYIARPIATVGHPSTSNLQAASGTFTGTLAVTGATTFSGTVTGAGSMVKLLEDTDPTGGTSYDIDSTYINSTYDSYEIEFILQSASDNDHLYSRVFVGGTVQTGSIYNFTISSQGDTSNDADGTGQTGFRMHRFSQGNEDGAFIGGRMRLQNVNSTTLPYFHTGMGISWRYPSAQYTGTSFSGSLSLANRADVVNGLRFYYNGSIASGLIRVYGIQ